jgi:hypothetical protein
MAAVVLGMVAISGAVAWRRKQQFDQKGYHKKRESDLPDC